MLSKIILICIFSFFFLFAFYLSSSTIIANEWCQTNCAVWHDPQTGEITDVDCPSGTNYLGQCNQTEPAIFCNTSDWTFHYNPTCSAINFQCSYQDWIDSKCPTGTTNCTWSQIQCNVADRCPNGTTGGTGYDANGQVSAGICDATKFNGNPDSACVTGGVYKQCCSSGGYYPTTYCSNGICPAGQITSAVTSCQSTPPLSSSTK